MPDRTSRNRLLAAAAVTLLVEVTSAFAREPAPLLSLAETRALASELSGESALRTVEGLSRQHRMRGSAGFDAAGEIVLAELARVGYGGAERIVLPADGTIYYGTQRSRPAWNVRFAELWEVDAEGARIERLASWDEAPLGLAQDSESASVAAAELVDVGAGTKEGDYAGREVAGRIVLTSSQPGAVAGLAVGKLGAAGIVSWAQNQKQGWWGEDESLVRWGHLETFATTKTFAFMVSPARARALASRLAAGERVRLSAEVDAGAETGAYSIPTATIAGADPKLGGEEIVFSCHLDHPRPGANDNASGCATILEVARALGKLVREGRLAPPRRTIRFVWPPEIEGTLALLAGRPEIAARIRAAIHLDMVGGAPVTKSIFHVTRGPASLPSFVHDLAAAEAGWVNDQSMRYAMTGAADFPLLAAGGGKEPLRAEAVELTLGSDHQVYNDSSFAIPAVYLNDWPDRYIHTDRDVASNIDPTKLERVAFVAAATGWALANLGGDAAEGGAVAAGAADLWRLQRVAALRRAASAIERQRGLPLAEADHVARFAALHERALFDSMKRFVTPPRNLQDEASRLFSSFDRLVGLPGSLARSGGTVYRRNPARRGTSAGFGHDWVSERLGAERAGALRLTHHTGARGGGGDYAYEALNLVDGRRGTVEIRDTLSAVYGPVPLEIVEEYLAALAEAELLLR
jgi:aminopeptidase YwaD